MDGIVFDKFILNEDIINVLKRLKVCNKNGKLKDIRNSNDGEIVVTCPNDEHNQGKEANPDCHINMKHNGVPLGYFHCFACGVKGDFLKFVSLCLNCSRDLAAQWLINEFGHNVVELKNYICEPLTFSDINKNNKRKTIKLDRSVLNQFQDWCPYLGKRGLTRETCVKFEVKYDPTNRQVIFPAYDIYGNLVMLPRRSIDTKTFYLDKEVDKPVYCLDKIIKNGIKNVIVTEGPFDCLLANQYGVPAIATLGTPSDSQIEQINKSGINQIYLMFDNDSAGEKFTTKFKNRISSRILVSEIEFPPDKKDIGELSYEEFWEIFNSGLAKQDEMLYNISAKANKRLIAN